jgi:hypothetical protein
LLDYDVEADTWGTMRIPALDRAGLFPAGDRLLLMTSCVCPNQPASVVAVDVDTGTTERLPNVPFPRTARRQMAVVDDDIYLFASPGGEPLRGVVLRDGASRWARLPTLPGEKVEVYPDSVYPLVVDDRILVADTTSAFDVSSQTWEPLSEDDQASLPHEYDYPETPLNATTAWIGDRWFAFGGHVHGGLTNQAFTWVIGD